MIEPVITDTGPCLHLSEIGATKAWTIFSDILIPDVMVRECHKFGLETAVLHTQGNFTILNSSSDIRADARSIENELHVGMNDAVLVAHARHEKAKLVCTDDLTLRNTLKQWAITPVGTIGLLLRAFRSGLFSLEVVFELLDRIVSGSTLYITTDLIEYIKRTAIEYQIRR